MESGLTALRVGVGDWNKKGKKEKEFMDRDNSVVIVGRKGVGGGRRVYKRINGNGKH